MESLNPPGIAVAVVLGLLLLVGNALSILATRMAVTGRLDRSSMGGIRTSSTRFSDESWTAAHRAALPWVTVCNGLGGVLGVVTMWLGLTVTPFLVTVGVAVFATVVGAVAQLIVGERAAARAVRTGQRDAARAVRTGQTVSENRPTNQITPQHPEN